MQPRPLGPRLGPRPLPLHLGTALMTWASSESAWRLWKPGSPSSNPSSAAPETLASLLPEIAALEARAGAGKFEQALRREIARRMRRLADGVLAYRQHTVHRTLDNPPAVWTEGNTRLLDYGATHRAARKRGARKRPSSSGSSIYVLVAISIRARFSFSRSFLGMVFASFLTVLFSVMATLIP